MKRGFSQANYIADPNKLLNSSLEALIEERKALEVVWRAKGERVIEPTTLSFPDIYGRNLLDYAILLSNKSRIKELIEKGVRSTTAVPLAIKTGQEDVIDWLEEKTCPVDLIELYSYASKEKILLQKYIKRKIQGIIKSGKYQLENLWHYYAFLEVEDITDELLQVAGNLNELDASKYTPLQYAILLKNDNMVKLMLSKGADPNLSDSKPRKPIYLALNNGNSSDILSILFKGDDEQVNSLAINPLFLAVASKNIDCVNFVLKQNLDYQFSNYLGRTILHELARIDNIAIIQLLLSKFEFKPLLEHKDFQGDDALQQAINRNNKIFIDCLKEKFGKEFIEKIMSTRKKEDRVLIKQTTINTNLKYFLRLFNHDPNMMGNGSCNGLGFLFLYYTDRQKRPEYFQCLSTISKWNGTIKMAEGILTKQQVGGNYQFLKDLLWQWSNDIIWFQQAYIDSELKKINAAQQNRMVQYDYLKKDNIPFFLKPFFKQKVISVNIEQLHEYVKILSCMPNIKVEFGGGKHLTTLYVHEKNKLDYYDPNQSYEMPYFTDAKHLTQYIAGFKYSKFQTTNMPLLIYAYKNLTRQQSDDFNYFLADQLPKDQNDVIAYQGTSPNNFTQLHVAVLTNSLSNVIDIIKNKKLDLNGKDSHGFCALDLALEVGCIDIIKPMVQSNCFILNEEKINTIFKIASKEKNMDLITTINVSDPIREFFKAVKNSDYEMTNALLLKGVDPNEKGPDIEDPETYDHTPLSLALANHDDKMVKILIQHGVKISLFEMNEIACNEDLVNEILINFQNKLPLMPSKYANGMSYLEEFLIDFDTDSESKLKLLDYFADHPQTRVSPYILNNFNVMKNFRDYYLNRRRCCDWFKKCIEKGAKIEEDTLIHVLKKFNKFGDDFGKDYVLSLIKFSTHFSPMTHDDTLLHCAIENTNSTDIVQALIERGSEVNCPRRFNFTNCSPYPIHLAIKLNKPDIVKLLLQKGADPFIRYDGKTAAEMAQENATIKSIFDEFEKENSQSKNLRKLL